MKAFIFPLALGLMITSPISLLFAAPQQESQPAAAAPTRDYNINYGWKFKKVYDFPLTQALENVKFKNRYFYDPKFSDKSWEEVSLPHAVNAGDSFDNAILDAGEQNLFRGFMFYRKKIRVPESDGGKKFFLEFEAARQSVYVYVNGKIAGYYEAGVTAVGFDITAFINPGKENLIAIATDNAAGRGASFQTQETIPGHSPGDASGSGFQWNTKDFNEVQGGITGNVILHARSSVYQTLPLYSNLKTTGTYITASNFDFAAGKADITVDAEVRNESGKDRTITLEVTVEDGTGAVKARFSSSGLVPGARDRGKAFLSLVPEDAYSEKAAQTASDTLEVSHIVAQGRGSGLCFWSPEQPSLYTVRSRLLDGQEVLDELCTTTGFREVAYDEARGGLLINGKNIYLKGYAQRSVNEWAAIGIAPDWLTDYDMSLVRESNANYIRWMHVAPKPAAVRSGDSYGIVSVCPAGDKEGDVSGRQWAQRVEAMRDAIIYFRNSPSVWFYEAGNNAISAEHMAEMTSLRQKLDPKGYRRMGCRSLSSPEQVAAAEWVGTMIWRYDAKAKEAMGQSNLQLPMLETEFKRDESPRRAWDDYTPPDYDYSNLWLGVGGKKKDHYDVWDQTQEDHILSLVSDEDGYAYFWQNRVGGESGKNYYAGAAMMVWSDSNMHGRNSGSENCRTSGRVDPIRLKKESFYAVQVLQSPVAKIHIIGHWNYPPFGKDSYWYREKIWDSFYWREGSRKKQRDPLHKTVYVVATPEIAKVELYVNGSLQAVADKQFLPFIFALPNVDVTQSGQVQAKAYDRTGKLLAVDEKKTAGAPAAIRLTPHTGPRGFLADGSDIAYIDVAIVDSQGNVCPTADNRIDFQVKGQGVFLGGYNSGKKDEQSVIHKDFVFAECGINRVFVRSTASAGSFSLTARVKGLENASLVLESLPVETADGISLLPPQRLFPSSFAAAPEPDAAAPAESTVLTESTASAAAAASNGKQDASSTGAAGSGRQAAYTITVNGEKVECKSAPYRPDSATGLLGEVRPVLEAIKAAGARFSYSYQQTGDLPAYLKDFHLPLLTIQTAGQKVDLVCGETALIIDEGKDKNLTNAEIYATEEGEVVAELASLLDYIEGVEVRTDSQARTLLITVR